MILSGFFVMGVICVKCFLGYVAVWELNIGGSDIPPSRTLMMALWN